MTKGFSSFRAARGTRERRRGEDRPGTAGVRGARGHRSNEECCTGRVCNYVFGEVPGASSVPSRLAGVPDQVATLISNSVYFGIHTAISSVGTHYKGWIWS